MQRLAIGDVTPAAHLPKLGEAGLAFGVLDEIVAVAFQFVGDHRLLAGRAPITADHVDQLRQLIEEMC